jgi:excisionase family DNA binding protein
MNQRPDPLLLSPGQAANALGISRTTLYGLLMSGVLPSVSVGRLRRIKASDLDAYISTLLPAPLG